MIEIAVNDLSKYYGSNHVIKGISFEIMKGEKVGLLGKNGSGKTTLFKILSGAEEYESGSIVKSSGKSIEVLEQIPVFRVEYTVEEVLRTAFEEIAVIVSELMQLERLINTDPAEKLLMKYGQLQTKYEALGGYEIEGKIDRICTGMKLGQEMRRQLFSDLSGGEKTRVNLARILLRNADILLLDEPTNHLDMASIQWVEEFLGGFKGTVVVISHDRCFLDNVAGRILEIEDGKMNFYEGNYSYYAQEKAKRFQLLSDQYEQQQTKIRQLEAAAKRMHAWAKIADNPAMHKRAFSMEKRIERIDRIDRPAEVKKLTAEFKGSHFSSEDVASFVDISKAYNGKQLLEAINIRVRKNDRIAVIGENGCGKSTLVKLLMGEEMPDHGNACMGSSTKTAYMPQSIEFEDGEATVLDTVRNALEISEEKARNILAGFQLKGKDVLKKSGTLSGGEKSRVKLCILMQGSSNFLLLDEPTNHLDIASREWIEAAVSQFKGTILFISHDRYFINKFATRIWEIKDGGITDFSGTFNEYCQWVKEHPKVFKEYAREKRKVAEVSKADPVKVEENSKQSQEIERQIEETERAIKGIEREMEAASADFNRLNLLYNEKTGLERSLDLLYNDWNEALADDFTVR